MAPQHPIPNPQTITVYGADWCGDCRRAKRVLGERETRYDWVDVAADPAIRDALTTNGYPAIPVVVMPNGTILMEPSNDELTAALDAAGVTARSAESPAAARP